MLVLLLRFGQHAAQLSQSRSTVNKEHDGQLAVALQQRAQEEFGVRHEAVIMNLYMYCL